MIFIAQRLRLIGCTRTYLRKSTKPVRCYKFAEYSALYTEINSNSQNTIWKVWRRFRNLVIEAEEIGLLIDPCLQGKLLL